MRKPQEESNKVMVIAGVIGNDDSITEMLHRPEDGLTLFMTHRVGEISEHASLDIPNVGKALPYSSDNNLLSHEVVLFPSTASEYRTEDQLLADVRAFIHRYSDLSDSFEEVASLYVLLSWVYDRYQVLPYLRLKGDYGSGKSRCLQVIGSICYRPMFVSGASTVSPMFRIIDSMRGTLILDESDFRFSDEKAEIIKILNNGFAAGFPVLRTEVSPTKEFNPRAFAVFGPKIIATRRDFDDQALESRCITEVMSGLPPRRDIPLALPDSFDSEALTLRNKLLMYRFRTLGRKPATEERQFHLEARVAQVFAPLLSIAPNEESRGRLLALAGKQSGRLRSDRGVSVEAQLLEVLYDMKTESVQLLVREITRRFIERFGVDYERPISAHWIGGQLRKKLSLLTMKSHGNYAVPDSESAKLERLFERFEIRDDRVDSGTLGTF